MNLNDVFIVFLLLLICQLRYSVASIYPGDSECEIIIEKGATERVRMKGVCIRLSNGVMSCQSAGFLDPFNSDCSFL
uniref:Secreted protein n=1 Tax=Ditylenchus dipsaci TaxID=166011 RepID=A0A915CZW0_9BILA